MLEFFYIFQTYKISTVLLLLIILYNKNNKYNIISNNILFSDNIYKILVLSILLLLLKYKTIFIFNLFFNTFFIWYLAFLIFKGDVTIKEYDDIITYKNILNYVLTYYYNLAFNIHYNISYKKKSKKEYFITFLMIILSINIIVINSSIFISNVIYISISKFNKKKSLISIIFYIYITALELLNNYINIQNKINKNKKIYKKWSKKNGDLKKILSRFFNKSTDINIIKNILNIDEKQLYLYKIKAGKKINENSFHYGFSTKDISDNKKFNLLTWFTSLRQPLHTHEFTINKHTKAGIIFIPNNMISSYNAKLSQSFKKNMFDEILIKQNNEPITQMLGKDISQKFIDDSKETAFFLKKILKQSNEHFDLNQTIKLITKDDEYIIELKKTNMIINYEISILSDRYTIPEYLTEHLYREYDLYDKSFEYKLELIGTFITEINLLSIDSKLDILQESNKKLYDSLITKEQHDIDEI